MENKNKPAEDALIKNLVEQMDRELEKPFEEQDMDYIEECSRRLQEIAGERYDPEPADRKESIEKIKRLGNRTSRKKVLIKRLGVAAAAACLVFVILGGGIAWADGDYSSLPLTELFDRIDWLLRPGESVETDENTFGKSDAKCYNSFEEMIASEKVAILYPNWLPDDTKIKMIIFEENNYQGGREIRVLFDDESVEYFVYLYDDYASENEELFTEEHLMEIDGNNYYVRTIGDKTNAVFYRNGYSYSVTAKNSEDLLGILKGLVMKN